MVAARHKPLLVIVGETASGKSQLAIALAKRFNGEIINADSWSVYRGFDIGTAKPTRRQRQLVPHHLIDVADPLEGFNAAEFKKMAVAAIDDIHARGKLPILSGGTGLYVDSVLFNYSFLPPGEGDTRERLNSLGLDELLELAEQRGYGLEGIDQRNKRRIIRLIESEGRRPLAQPIRQSTLIIGLRHPEGQISQAIKARVERMLEDGLAEEVKQLADRYGWEIEPMKGIGYREFMGYWGEGGLSIDQIAQKIINDSVALIKKQRTWLKHNNSIHWVDNSGEVIDITTTFLNKF
jgi:tRNA dimethylallyltransferase